MPRRYLVHGLVSLAIALLSPEPAAASGTGARPNFVLILADDLGYGDLGSYGNPSIRTPNLDRMAAEGIRFTQFYSASSVCSPSRAALMTGRQPVRFEMNAVLPPVTKRGLPAREVTVGKLLQSAGYATACIGKWHLGRLKKYLPTNRGFDRFFGLPYSNDMSPKTNAGPLYRLHIIPPLPLLRGVEVVEQDPDQSELTRRYTEEAITFIGDAAARRKPFFLYLAHTSPHPPLSTSPRFRGVSERGLYGDSVEELDWSTGEILRTLRELDLDSSTLVMFTSDNGPWLARKSRGGSAGLLREGKGSTWDGGVRVPLIARWPGRISPGQTSLAFATTMDILPTFAALAGTEPAPDRPYDGEDISAQLLAGAPGREALLFLWFQHELRAVRKGPWKLHVITNNPANGTRAATRHASPLLFNVQEDPGERFDVAAEHPGIVRDLLQLMERHRREIGRRRAVTLARD